MRNAIIHKIIIVIIILFIVACTPLPKGMHRSCITRIQPYTIRGHSLTGVLEHRENITAYLGYQNCNNLQDGDVVVWKTNVKENPLIKIVKGVPGDNFSIEKYTLFRNGEVLRNNNGTAYSIKASNARFLATYFATYPTIPEGYYFLIGNAPIGGLDSTQLGYISQSDILGIVDCCGRFTE